MERIDSYLRKLLISSSWIRHGLFWLVFILINSISASGKLNSTASVAVYVGAMLGNMLVFYSTYLLYLLAKKYNSGILFAIAIVAGPPLICSLITVRWYWYWNPGSTEMTFLSFYAFYVFIAVLAATLKFGKDMYVWQQHEFQRKQEQAESELNLLKAQISPHFLFNTLNNLYGHAVAKSDLLPDMMLKLSDLLRYTIYETGKPLVPLHDELDYISNYIALEKMRLPADCKVSFDLPEKVNMRLQIAPLLLIAFVENAFKHSRNTLSHQLFISGSIVVDDSRLIMEIKNSFNPEVKAANLLKREGGVGLENVQKRLKLLYPDKHVLQTNESNGIYCLKLQLDL